MPDCQQIFVASLTFRHFGLTPRIQGGNFVFVAERRGRREKNFPAAYFLLATNPDRPVWLVCGLVVCVLDSVFFCFVCVGLNWGACWFWWVFWFFLFFVFFDADDFGTFCFLIVGVCFCWIVFWLEPMFLVFVGEFDPGSG